MTQRSNPTPQLQALIEHDPDLVDRIFEYLTREFPQIGGPEFAKAKRAVRAEFHGERVRVNAQSQQERHELAQAVLSLFNGRNATEVARHLRIGRTTVYRLIKQSGTDRPTLAQIGTPQVVRSATSTDLQANQPEPPPWPSPSPISTTSTQPSPAENSRSATAGGPSPIDP